MIKLVLIDAGHGEETPGKRSPDGTLREWKFNRQVASLLMECLIRGGVEARCIVTENNDVSLAERCRRVNEVCKEIGKDNVLLVSIHANAHGDGSAWTNAHGWEIFSAPGATRSKSIAANIAKAFTTAFGGDNIRGAKDENFYILRHTLCPAVLTENFFMTNKTECAYMKTKAGQYRIAEVISQGIFYTMLKDAKGLD